MYSHFLEVTTLGFISSASYIPFNGFLTEIGVNKDKQLSVWRQQFEPIITYFVGGVKHGLLQICLTSIDDVVVLLYGIKCISKDMQCIELLKI